MGSERLFAWTTSHAPTPDGPGSAHFRMVIGMATTKVTSTPPSAHIRPAVGAERDDVAAWGAVLAHALEKSGGPLTDAEREWADLVLGVPKRRGRRIGL